MEELKKKNFEENKRNNIALKQQLKAISNQIEEIFEQEENRKNNKLQNSLDNSNKVDLQEFNSFQSKIDKYKRNIESIKKKLKAI